MGNYFTFPSPRSTYSYVKDDPTLIFIPKQNDETLNEPSSNKESQKTKTKIPCRFIPTQNHVSPFLLIFFHGNSEDIGFGLSQFLSLFSGRFHMDVLCPEYPGYGIYQKNSSLPIDEVITEDARTIMKFCHEKMRYEYRDIILIGRSIGTGVAVQIATEFEVRGTVLISAFTSIKDVGKHLVGSFLAKMAPDVYRNIDCIHNIKMSCSFHPRNSRHTDTSHNVCSAI